MRTPRGLHRHRELGWAVDTPVPWKARLLAAMPGIPVLSIQTCLGEILEGRTAGAIGRGRQTQAFYPSSGNFHLSSALSSRTAVTGSPPLPTPPEALLSASLPAQGRFLPRSCASSEWQELLRSLHVAGSQILFIS